jgi:hypothetical protein
MNPSISGICVYDDHMQQYSDLVARPEQQVKAKESSSLQDSLRDLERNWESSRNLVAFRPQAGPRSPSNHRNADGVRVQPCKGDKKKSLIKSPSSNPNTFEVIPRNKMFDEKGVSQYPKTISQVYRQKSIPLLQSSSSNGKSKKLGTVISNSEKISEFINDKKAVISKNLVEYESPAQNIMIESKCLNLNSNFKAQSGPIIIGSVPTKSVNMVQETIDVLNSNLQKVLINIRDIDLNLVQRNRSLSRDQTSKSIMKVIQRNMRDKGGSLSNIIAEDKKFPLSNSQLIGIAEGSKNFMIDGDVSGEHFEDQSLRNSARQNNDQKVINLNDSIRFVKLKHRMLEMADEEVTLAKSQVADQKCSSQKIALKKIISNEGNLSSSHDALEACHRTKYMEPGFSPRGWQLDPNNNTHNTQFPEGARKSSSLNPWRKVPSTDNTLKIRNVLGGIEKKVYPPNRYSKKFSTNIITKIPVKSDGIKFFNRRPELSGNPSSLKSQVANNEITRHLGGLLRQASPLNSRLAVHNDASLGLIREKKEERDNSLEEEVSTVERKNTLQTCLPSIHSRLAALPHLVPNNIRSQPITKMSSTLQFKLLNKPGDTVMIKCERNFPRAVKAKPQSSKFISHVEKQKVSTVEEKPTATSQLYLKRLFPKCI